jgi:DNA-binding response OmpR family regulator
MAGHAPILIVDDDPGAAEAFEPMLRGRGFDVCVAADADAGWTAIARFMPSAIVLDLHLPGLDGVEFLRRLRSTSGVADIPVAIVSGDYLIDEHVTDDIQSLGARLYFKPLWEEDLAQIVAALLKVDSGLPAIL